MSLDLVPHAPAHNDQARAFNQRLREGGWESFGLEENPRQLRPDDLRRPVSRQHFVAVDHDGDVRGGLLLQRQPVKLGPATEAGANVQAPIAEGVVDHAYASIAAVMMKRATALVPFMFAVGMGGTDQPLPRLLSALRWSVSTVPFYYRVHRPGRFLGGFPLMRATAARRALTDLARLSGLGRVTLPLLFRPRRRSRALAADRVTEWGGWADDVWHRMPDTIAFSAVRTADTLAGLYPPDTRCLLYRVSDGGDDVGWLALADTVMSGDPNFGDLRVGTILDGIALPGKAASLVSTGDCLLAERGVDLALSNQLHPEWIEGLEAAGYRAGPSNYLFAASPALDERIGAAGETGVIHVNRGDGDGRIHL